MSLNVSGEEASSERRAPPANPSLLEAAIERGGLHPFFHAKVSMANKRIVGAEALARIASAQTFAAPGPYVELAERNNRIDALTFAMARVVVKAVAGFGQTLPCSINVSPASVNKPDFPNEIAKVITEGGLKCGQFTLELTEARSADYGPHAKDSMTALRDMGFGLAVDDFGAGATNIDRLRALPFTEVKI